MSEPKTRKGKHLGLYLSNEIGEKLERLIRDEQEKVGPSAVVSASSLVISLILKEDARRFSSEKVPKKKPI